MTDQGNRKIRRVAVATGEVTKIAGSGEEGGADGVGDAAQFYSPSGIAISPDGSALFVADCNNNKIRRVEVATGEVRTTAGSDAWATRRSSAPQLASPSARTATRCL